MRVIAEMAARTVRFLQKIVAVFVKTTATMTILVS